MSLSSTTQSAVISLKNQTSRFNKFKLIFLIVIVLLVLFVMLWPRDNVYSITGDTEAITIVFSEDAINQWDISGAIYNNGFPDENNKSDLLPEDSYFFPNKDTTARVSIIKALDRSNELLIIFTSSGASTGYIESSEGTIELLDYVEMKLPIEKASLLAFEGETHIGEDVGQGVDKILLSGEVRIIERQLFRDKKYIAGDYLLDSGDRLTLYKDDSLKNHTNMKGFLRVSDKTSFDFTVHGEGAVLLVFRLGSADYQITPSVWSRISKDPIIAAITTILATVFLLMEFLDLLLRFVLKPKDNESE
jgi:hypothetical protein